VREIASRIDGISTPLGGVSWTPPTPDSEVVQRLLLFLEDRRVLYEPYEVEMPEHCIESVFKIRAFLTLLLDEGGISTELSAAFRGLRGACREFFRQIRVRSDSRGLVLPEGAGGPQWGMTDLEFNQALGELRAAFGLQVGRLAVTYGLDVEEPLSTILPAPPE